MRGRFAARESTAVHNDRLVWLGRGPFSLLRRSQQEDRDGIFWLLGSGGGVALGSDQRASSPAPRVGIPVRGAHRCGCAHVRPHAFAHLLPGAARVSTERRKLPDCPHRAAKPRADGGGSGPDGTIAPGALDRGYDRKRQPPNVCGWLA